MLIKFFNWYGGKYRIVHIILALLPDGITAFYEPFMGSAAVTLNKWRSSIEVINDLDPDIAFLFKLMADKEKGKTLLDRLLKIEYSESEFIRAKRASENRFRYIQDEFRKAELIYILITQSFNATRTSFRRGITNSEYQCSQRYNLPLVYQRLQGVKVLNMNGIDLMKEIKHNPTAFAFLDPPYRHELRSKGATKVYRCELPHKEQKRLLKTIADARCKIMLCGYRSKEGVDLYDQYLLPYGWKHYKLAELVKSCQCNMQKRDIGEEWIWVNYELPYVAKYFINLKTCEI